MKPLRGRLIAEIIPLNHIRESGLIIVNRTDISLKAKVIAVGADSMDRKFRVLRSPVIVGDIVHFKKFTPMTHKVSVDGLKKGIITLWFGDVLMTEDIYGIEATFDNILVKVVYKDTSETIIIPEKYQKENSAFRGKVVSIGPEYKYDVKIGDKIIFPRNEGFPVSYKDEDYMSLRERWVLGVIEK